MKTYLGISSNTYDTFLTDQLNLVSDVVEAYCRRKFMTANYVETFYLDDFEMKPTVLTTFHYPIKTITSIVEDIVTISVDDYRVQKDYGIITKPDYFFREASKVIITYQAGFDVAPSPIRSVVMSIVEERYNKKVSGVSLNFGSDVQRVSIPGTISIDFDYSLTSNDRKNAFGNIVGNYMNILDPYRSERALMGPGRIAYVD